MKKALVALCCNNLDVTKKFINCALEELDSSYDLYILDNGSTDGTFEYLMEVQRNTMHDDTKMQMYISRSDTNLGFSGGNNRLLKRLLNNNEELAKLNHQAQDFYSNIILVNNDILFTKESLERLVLVCNSSKEVGATGPISNNVSGIQKVNIDGLTDQTYRQYAEKLLQSKDTHVGEVGLLIGFCMCLKTSIVKEIGLLDERFGIGSYEDNDYCLRIRNAGYKLVMVKESLIYHYGSQTVKQFDYMNIMIDNKYKFIEKYNVEESMPAVIFMTKEGTPEAKIPFEHIKYTYKDTPKITQEMLVEAAKYSNWCMVIYDNEFMDTFYSRLDKIIKNVLPDKDLINVKIAHVNDNGTLDLTKGADWQGRILRLRKNSKGEYINFNEVPKDAQVYTYSTIYSFKEPIKDYIDISIPKNKISASLIVKDESKYIRLCMESIKDLVDEIVIVDTGSTDNTKEICKQYTDKIYDYKWNDSFADARNFALSKCTGDWIFRIDGDEEVPVDLKVNAYNAMINGEADAFLVPIKNVQPDGTAPLSTTLRVFKNDKNIKYDGRVHEEIDTCIKKLGFKALKINNYLYHYGYLKGIQNKKTDLYFKLLMLDYNDNPKNFKTLMNLANHYVHQGNYSMALEFYKECIANGGGEDPVILHDYAIAKYKYLLSKNQSDIREILCILDKAQSNLNVCYQEQVDKFKKNYNIIKGMILDKN